MQIESDVEQEIADTLRDAWEEREGRVVPDDNSVSFGNDAVKIEAVVLYADLTASTALADNFLPTFAAKAIKAFLLASARLVRYFDGEITAYDGDRIMAVYIDDRPRTRAARTALAINWAMVHVVNPRLKSGFQIPADFYLAHAVGIDVSELFVIKAGIRAGSDLTWVGRAANKAAKLSGLREGDYRSFIDQDVFTAMMDDAKSHDGHEMWEQRSYGGRTIYRSRWWKKPSA